MPEPFLKWPGGKRWLVRKYPALFPKHFRRLIEPFLGSGAVFFHLKPEAAILSDANEDLIACYKAIKNHPEQLDGVVRGMHKRHSAAFYYRVRSSTPHSELGRAARFLYLNRTCFNGIYRVNLKGQFNVPMGTKNRVAFPQGYLLEVARTLKAANIHAGDFEETILNAEAGDFVYIDPPYTVMHNNNNFVKYNDTLFSWEDQIRLAKSVRLAVQRGAQVLVSNADHPSVRELYLPIGKLTTVSRPSVLAASASARRPTTEIAVTNTREARPV